MGILLDEGTYSGSLCMRGASPAVGRTGQLCHSQAGTVCDPEWVYGDFDVDLFQTGRSGCFSPESLDIGARMSETEPLIPVKCTVI